MPGTGRGNVSARLSRAQAASALRPYLLIELRDGVLLRGSYVCIRHGCAATLGLRQFAEEALKSGGRHKNQEATSPWHHPPLRVRNAARSERNLAGTDMELIVAHLDYVLPFEHVPQFVFVLMNVKRRVERVDFFNDGERSAGRSAEALTMNSASLNRRRSPPPASSLKPDPCHVATVMRRRRSKRARPAPCVPALGCWGLGDALTNSSPRPFPVFPGLSSRLDVIVAYPWNA
jgi:hypothetical protein